MRHCRVEQAAPHRVHRRALRSAVAVVDHRRTAAVSVDGIEQWRRRRQKTVRRQHRPAS